MKLAPLEWRRVALDDGFGPLSLIHNKAETIYPPVVDAAAIKRRVVILRGKATWLKSRPLECLGSASSQAVHTHMPSNQTLEPSSSGIQVKPCGVEEVAIETR